MDAIWDYVASDLQNVSAAERIVNRIMDDVDRLESHAEIGALLSSIADVESDYRFLVTGNYLTFYRVYGNDVYVDRVLSSRRVWNKTIPQGAPKGKEKTASHHPQLGQEGVQVPLLLPDEQQASFFD